MGRQPLLTKEVDAILRSGAGTVRCSLDLNRSIATVEADAGGWAWQGERYPYLETCKDRTIYYWTGESFEPVQRFTESLGKLVPTEWGAPTFAIEGRLLSDFLRWAGRETGRAIVYASPEAEREAAQIVLRGSIEGLRPDESIGAVGSTTGLALTVERDRIEVRPAER